MTGGLIEKKPESTDGDEWSDIDSGEEIWVLIIILLVQTSAKLTFDIFTL